MRACNSHARMQQPCMHAAAMRACNSHVRMQQPCATRMQSQPRDMSRDCFQRLAVRRGGVGCACSHPLLPGVHHHPWATPADPHVPPPPSPPHPHIRTSRHTRWSLTTGPPNQMLLMLRWIKRAELRRQRRTPLHACVSQVVRNRCCTFKCASTRTTHAPRVDRPGSVGSLHTPSRRHAC
eukprot:364757-Chlamydomonas_euryale.AAC.8